MKRIILMAGAAAALMILSTPAFSQNAYADTADVAPVISDDGALFAQFGGHDGLVKLTDDFMVILLDDPRTRDFFVAVKQDHVKAMLVEQFCHILNGGCIYSGKSMKESHAKLGIDHASFYALVEDLQKAMTRNKIPFAAQNKLLAALAPQHRDIITP